MPKEAKTSRLKTKPAPLPTARAFLYMAIIMAVGVITWWMLIIFYEPSHPAKAASYYNNLDLSLARQANYTNHPIIDIKNFGTQNKVTRKLVSFDVPKDGLSEYALLTLPTSKPTHGKYPVIILCHGYTSPAFYSTLDGYLSDMEFYSQHGFAVLKPDFRGNGFSVTSGTPDGAYYSMSYNTDVMSLIAAVKKTSYLNAKQISLWGHSMGAYIALRAAVLSPEVKNLVLLSAPAGNAQQLYGGYLAVSDQNNTTALEIRDQELTIHGTPVSNPDFWNSASPINYLSDLKANVQIYVGSRDKIVPPQFSADLNTALAKAKIKHEYFVLKGGTHGLVAQRPQIWVDSLKLLKNNP